MQFHYTSSTLSPNTQHTRNQHALNQLSLYLLLCIFTPGRCVSMWFFFIGDVCGYSFSSLLIISGRVMSVCKDRPLAQCGPRIVSETRHRDYFARHWQDWSTGPYMGSPILWALLLLTIDTDLARQAQPASFGLGCYPLFSRPLPLLDLAAACRSPAVTTKRILLHGT